MSSKYTVKEIIPLEPSKDVLSQGDDLIAEEQSANDLVNVKFPSRPRRQITIVVAVIVIVIIVIAVLVGTFVPNHLRNDDEDNQCKENLIILLFYCNYGARYLYNAAIWIQACLFCSSRLCHLLFKGW